MASQNIQSVDAIISQHSQTIRASYSESENPVVVRLSLTSIQSLLPSLLQTLNSAKSDKSYPTVYSKLQALSAQVDDALLANDKRVKTYSESFEDETPIGSSAVDLETPASAQDNDYASLRRRLLADGASTSLDEKQATSENMNDYHESLQEEIISDLTHMATDLKTSAQALSSKIIDDSKLVSETSENMHKSSTLMQSVGGNLNSYLNEKTGGKITIFFLIQTMAFIFILFFFMVVITKILPKM